MPFQRVPATAEFRVLQETAAGTTPLVQMICSVYLRRIGTPWTPAGLDAAATDVKNRWNTYVRPHQSASIKVVEVQARNLDEEFGAVAVVASGTTGGTAGTTSSTMLCFGARLGGAPGGAPRVGRLFIPGVGETVIQDNVITESVRATLQTDLNAFYDAFYTADYEPVLVSRYSKSLVTPTNQSGRRAVAVTNRVDSIVVRSLAWSQRDRRPAPLSG